MFTQAGDAIRHDWTRQEIRAIYDLPLPDLIYWSQTVHRRHHNPNEVQACQLLSIKTGACPEDCKYCPQSAHYKTQITKHGLMSVEDTLKMAQKAKDEGATRFCMGAAWRKPPTRGPDFENVLEMVRGVRALGMEACVTLGMLTEEQAQRLADAGMTAYNHNLDTSPEYYDKIISTRTYEDRLQTLENVRKSGATVCCGGIVGMGESLEDRVGLLHQLAILNPHPESVPINLLARIEGTPLAKQADLETFEMVRCLATARIIMPKAKVRLSCGRLGMSDEMHLLCYLAGANSIFMGDRLLTTENPGADGDARMLENMGMKFAEL
jgi:biotin synthase